MLRIIAGEFKGRRLRAPAGRRVRPTGDRVKEAWFSILQQSIPDARVLDLFAGSGALGLEAISRGAVRADFVEIAPRSLAALRANITTLGAGAAAVVHRADAIRFAAALDESAFDVAFADPPYDAGLGSELAERWLAVPFARVLTIEHRVDEVLPGNGDRRKYGDTVITIFRTTNARN